MKNITRIIKKQASSKINKYSKSIDNDLLLYEKIIKRIIPNIEEIDQLSVCLICRNNISVDNVILIEECNHFYCYDCVKNYIKLKIDNGDDTILCINNNCKKKLSYYFIRNFLDNETLEKFESNLLNKCVLRSSDMCYCPRNDCSKICVKNECSNKVNCMYCFYQSCFICKEIYKENHICENKNLLKNVPNDILSSFGDINKIKQCPKCKIVIEKKTGCNSVKCINCKITFCWQCLNLSTNINKNDSKHKCNDYYEESSSSRSSSSIPYSSCSSASISELRFRPRSKKYYSGSSEESYQEF